MNVTQTITVDDVTPPTASNPVAVAVECIGDVPASDITAVTDALDNCTVSPVVAFVSDVSDGNTCPEVITRTYSVTDDCGNTMNVTQTITVDDVTPPTASSPMAVAVECIGDVPASDVTAVTDAADNCTANPLVAFVSDVSDGNTCPEVITRTYSVTDDCGNTMNVTQTITVDDVTPPTASSPMAVAVECIGDVPASDVTAVTDAADNCTANPLVAFVSDVSDGNTCPEVITRTYSVTDDCGNTMNVTQTITVDDVTPPTASNPSAIAVECTADIPASDITAVTDALDNCTVSPVVAFVSDVSDGNTCPEVITRTYSVTDDCGNTMNVTQTITVDDVTPPTASNPPDINIAIAPSPAPDITVVSDAADNCTVSPVVAFVSDVSDGNPCPEVITRTYSVTDDCGNETIVTQLIIIGGGTVPQPNVSANGPICEGNDAVFTITGQADAIVTYDIGSGNNTIPLTGGSATVTVSAVTTNTTITLTNISDGFCNTILNLTATTSVNGLSPSTFTQLGSYCVGDVPDVLLGTSIEGINGTWSPATINTATPGTSTYTFTIDAGQCALGTTMDVDITAPTTPTFTQIAPICINSASPTLPVTSDNGITGTWTPATINTSTSGTSTYTFTPDAGICATTATIDITIDPAVQSTFTQLGSYCVGDVPDVLLGTSIEGINGTWSPATINTATPGTSTYTFTIDAGQCALGTTMDVDITAPTTPTFTQIAPICINSASPTLPVTSDNGITGTWTPATINTSTSGTSTYTFTPDAGICATTATIDITIDPAVQSTFTQLGSYCVGDVPDVLLGTSIEGINGTWSPATINTATPGTSTYTFTIDAGQCALGTTMDVDITAPTTPTFTQIAPICINSASPTLPVTSDNGITGTWTPATINTSTSGTSTYTFTPDAGICATTATIDITIDPAIQSTFAQLGSYCVGDTPGALLSTSLEGITGTWSPATINTASAGTSTHTFTIDAGQCALGTTMDVDITAPTLPTFTQIAPICINTAALVLPTTSDNGVTGSWTPSTINTTTAGTSTYTFTPDVGICASTATMDITIDPAIQSTFAQLGSYCVGDTPGALLSTSLEGITGTWSPATINTASAGTSTHTFTIDAGQCALGTTMDVDITAPTLPTFTQIAPICINTAALVLPTTSDNGVTGSWTPSTINTTTAGTSTYTFTPDVGICASTATMDITIVALPIVDTGIDQVITCVTNVGGAQIGSSPISGNTYNWVPSSGLTDPNIANPIADPIGTTTYTVTVTNSAGCTSVGQVNVSLDNSPPIIGINNNTGSTVLTCTLIDISLSATGGDSYSWDSGLGISSNVTINTPGTYMVTGYATNGCESTSQIVITEDIDVDVIVTLADDEICSGEDATINVGSTNATSFDWTVIQNGVAGATAGTGFNSAQGLDITQTLTTIGNTPGTVDYIISPVLGSCTGSSQTVTVNVNPPEIPSFVALGPYCLDEITGDYLSATSDNNISGAWSPSGISTSNIGVTTYTFTPTIGECATVTTMEIVVNALPTVIFSADNVEGCAPLNVTLNGGSATGNNIWTIGNGEVLNGTSVNTTFLFPGCYDVTLLVQENGCSNTMTITDYICVQNDPFASFTVSPQSFTDVNQLVTFTNSSQGAVDYIWEFGDGFSSQTYEPSHLYGETEAGVFITLIAISDFGCIDSTQVFIPFDEQEIFYVPNTFTPDGDNFNQVFSPVFYSGFDPYNFEMLIFNRWGELIFETHDSEKGWDGGYGVGGIHVQDGVYTWKIIYKNPETDERKIVIGHVTLLR